jgi:hypothetical protein
LSFGDGLRLSSHAHWIGVIICLLHNLFLGGEADLTFQDVLAFFTGAERIPPLGFHNQPTLNFNDNNPFPTASTCGIVLTLPTQYHDNYRLFKEKMVFALKYHGGFGLH